MSRLLSTFVLGLLASVAIVAAPRPAAALLVLNTNLVANGDAEAGVPGGPIPGFTSVTGDMQAVSYSTGSGFPVATDPGPANRGLNFFAGGNAPVSRITQTVSVADGAASIDAGLVTFSLSAFLGGFAGQDDNASFTVLFQNGTSGTLGSAALQGPTAAGRGGQTGLFPNMTTGAIPVGTRALLFTLGAIRTSGSYNDGYADNLSFVAAASSPPTSVPEPASLALLGAGLLGLAASRRKHR